MQISVTELSKRYPGGKLALKDIDLNIPNGLGAVGFTRDDIPRLVQGTLPQQRVIKLSPRPAGEEELTRIFEDAMQYW